jgi:hypothetical protein
MTRYSTLRYYVYREHPYKVLYMSGRGFCEPEVSLIAEKRHDRHVWYFADKRVAQAVARATTATDPDRPCFVAEGLELARWRHSHYKTPIPANALEDLA